MGFHIVKITGVLEQQLSKKDKKPITDKSLKSKSVHNHYRQKSLCTYYYLLTIKKIKENDF